MTKYSKQQTTDNDAMTQHMEIKLKRENAQKTLNIKTKKCTRENGTLNKIEQYKKQETKDEILERLYGVL